MGKDQKYYNFNSPMLDPVCVRDYVSPDGMWAVIPVIGNKEWVIIHEGKVLSDVSRTFQSAMNKVEKYKKSKSGPRKRTKTPDKQKSQKIEKSSSGGKGSQTKKTSATKKTTKPKKKSSGQLNKVAQSTGNPLLDALQ